MQTSDCVSEVELVKFTVDIKLKQKQSCKEVWQNVSVVDANLVRKFVKQPQMRVVRCLYE